MQLELEAVVEVLEDQHVGVDGRPEDVAPDLERPVGVVVHHVEEGRRVGGPGTAVVGAGHDLVEVEPGAQVAEAEGVDLVALEVDRPREPPAVRADLDQALLGVRRAARVVHDLKVEQEVLGSVRLVGRPAQQLVVLQSRRGHPAVAPAALLPRRRLLDLGDPRGHLRRELGRRRAQVAHPRVVVVALRPQVGGGLRLVRIVDPGVRIDVTDAMKHGRDGSGRRDRRSEHAQTVIHPSRSRCFRRKT